MLKPLYKAAGLLAALLYLVLFTSSFKVKHSTTVVSIQPVTVLHKLTVTNNEANFFDKWELAATGLSKDAFELAFKGFEHMKEKGILLKENILTIIDFSKSSSQERLFIIDMLTGKLLLKSLVAHGHNSGNEYATKFSNANESHESSLGFYVTLNTYNGEHGYSLKLKGCEKGINDAAYDRAIVIHGADYVSENFIKSKGYIGRSFGCPAVPESLHRKIVDLLKDGSCLFIFHPTPTYLTRSEILNG
ncbi:MAG: murein L,D-transpeptidase catalytic domain family protein [Ferruginibacter sp.]